MTNPSPQPSRTHRILLAKPGLDGHDRGIKVVAKALTEAGYEVIYTGLHQEPDAIIEAALEEDVDAIGLSILSGAHMTLFSLILEKLKENAMGEVLVFGGGIIPKQDIQALKQMGIAEVFGPGTDTGKIIAFLDTQLAKRDGQGNP